MRSLREPKNIPSNKNSSRVEQDEQARRSTDDPRGHDDEDDSIGPAEGPEVCGAPGPEPVPVTAVVLELYRGEIGGLVTPLLLDQVAGLVAQCPDLGAWRHAFTRSIGARDRWAYVTACIRNEIAEQRCLRARVGEASAAQPVGGASAVESQGGRRRAASAALPDTDTPAALWGRVLEAIKLMTTRAAFHQLFAGTTCLECDGEGGTWRVAAASRRAVESLSTPRCRRLIEQAMRYADVPEADVTFVVRDRAD